MKGEKKTHKHLKKKTKIIILVSVLVLVLAGIGVGLFFLLSNKPEPEPVLSDTEYLIKIESWEKTGAPTVIWTFRDDRVGELTTNKTNYYTTKWALEEDGAKLHILTNWLYELDDTFEFSLDRENNTFTVKNLADETESVFVPLGTSVEEPVETEKTEQTEKVEKAEE